MSLTIAATHGDQVLKTFILFVETGKAASKTVDSQLRKAQRLSMAKYLALMAVAEAGGRVTPSELAERSNTKRHNITTLVDRLKRQRLVTTRRSARDRRSIEVILTDKGRQALRQAKPAARAAVHHLMRGIDGNDAIRLKMYLESVGSNIG